MSTTTNIDRRQFLKIGCGIGRRPGNFIYVARQRKATA